MNDARIVITGIGAVSPVGIGIDSFWESLKAGKSGINQIKSFDTAKYTCTIGGEINDFNPELISTGLNATDMGRGAQLANVAASLALRDSKIDLEEIDLAKVGICLGTSEGEIQSIQSINYAKFNSNCEDISDHKFLEYSCGSIGDSVAAAHNIKGPNTVIPTACAAGNYAIGYASDLIRLGIVDIMLAGGVDPFSRKAFLGFNRVGALAKEYCSPFDKNRTGIVVSEGAGILVLEKLVNAIKRKAPIYAELLGYGLSCDGTHMTNPSTEGIALAMTKAIHLSDIQPHDVDYICAHGTGTKNNDRTETLAIKNVYTKSASKLMISSIKSMMGHTMGAASALGAITCAMAVKHNFVPPTINYSEKDPECDLDYVPNQGRSTEVNVAMNNGFAFGGNNCCLIIKKYRS